MTLNQVILNRETQDRGIRVEVGKAGLDVAFGAVCDTQGDDSCIVSDASHDVVVFRALEQDSRFFIYMDYVP